MRTYRIIFFLWFAAGAASLWAQQETAAPTVESARELAGRGRLDQAMAQLDALSAQAPEPPGVERLRGIIFYQREQFTDAIAAFTEQLHELVEGGLVTVEDVEVLRYARHPDRPGDTPG